jgi:hypothetical protein
MGTITRLHGTAPRRAPVHFYDCTIHHRRGSAVCSNGFVLRQSVVEEAILGAIAELLDPPILGAAVDKALERRRAENGEGPSFPST